MTKVIVIQECELQSLFSNVLRTELAAFIPHASEKTDSAHILLNRRQAAKKLQISLPTLTKYVRHGIVKGYKLDGQIRFKSNEIESSLVQIKTGGRF
jgi:hypothetical protein